MKTQLKEVMKEEIKMQNPKDYITREEIMADLGISGKYADELIRNKNFPSIPLGKKLWVVPLSAYTKFKTDPTLIVAFKNKNLSDSKPVKA